MIFDEDLHQDNDLHMQLEIEGEVRLLFILCSTCQEYENFFMRYVDLILQRHIQFPSVIFSK